MPVINNQPITPTPTGLSDRQRPAGSWRRLGASMLIVSVIMLTLAPAVDPQPSIGMPSPVAPGQQVLIHGRAFEAAERLALMWGSSWVLAEGLEASDEGEFETPVRIPDDATMGSHIVSAVAERDEVASTSVTVVADEDLPGRPDRVPPSPIAGSPTPTPTPTPTPHAPSAPSTPVVASALHVSPSGSDSNPGSAAAPFRTVAKGLASVGAGQTLYLRGGTYVEDIALRMPAGTAAAPIVVSAYPGERPVIKGLVALTDLTHVTLDGFNVTWNSGKYDQHMLKITGGSHWTLQNSEIWGARSFANLLISGNPQQWTVRGNVIHNTYGGEANVNRSHNIYANTGLGASAGLIERNLIFNAPHGANLKLAGSGGSDGGAANVTVRYNTLHSATQPLFIGDGSHNITVTRNIIGASARGNLVRLYELVGANVSVRDNLGFAGSAFCDDYKSPTRCSSVVSTSRFPHDPRFTSTNVGGFVPRDSTAATYGRYAP